MEGELSLATTLDREAVIEGQLTRPVKSTDLSEFGDVYLGKVRDSCTTPDDRYVIVVSDRISAFDHVLREQIPFKGQVLNQLAAYFFGKTADIVENHVLSVPDPNVTIAEKCTVFPIEFVVRGYLVGHAWREYRSGKRMLCGNMMEEGLIENERFAQPILTPTTKAASGHDEDTTRDAILSSGTIERVTYDRLESYALALFHRGTEMANERGLILVDTKYEFGLTKDGRIMLVDEVHTPDSSRYFYSDTYDDLLAAGQPQRQLSKEFVREWLMDRGFRGLDGQLMPKLSDAFRIEVASRYIELFEAVTGSRFEPAVHADPGKRIRDSVRRALSV